MEYDDLILRDYEGRNLFHYILTYHILDLIDSQDIYTPNVSITDSQLKSLNEYFVKLQYGNNSAFNQTIKHLIEKNEKFVYCDVIADLLKGQDELGRTPLHRALFYSRAKRVLFKGAIIRYDNRYNNIYEPPPLCKFVSPAKNKSIIHFIKPILEFCKRKEVDIFSIQDSKKRNIFHDMFDQEDLDAFTIFDNIVKIFPKGFLSQSLLQLDEDGNTPILIFLLNKNIGKPKKLKFLELILKTLDGEKYFCKILKHKNKQNKSIISVADYLFLEYTTVELATEQKAVNEKIKVAKDNDNNKLIIDENKLFIEEWKKFEVEDSKELYINFKQEAGEALFMEKLL